MSSFEGLPDEKSPASLGSRKQTSLPIASRKSPRSREKVANDMQFGSKSSSPIPTRSGLTPDQPRVKRSSFHLLAPDIETFSNQDPLPPGTAEEVDSEMETPTKKPLRRIRPKSSEPTNLAESSISRRTVGIKIDADANQEPRRLLRPPFETSHTSPEMQDETARRGQRPNVTERAASDTATPVKKLSGIQLDGDIAKLIKDGPTRDRDKEKVNGSIYFYIVKPRSGEVRLLKIGRTEKHPNERRIQIKGICGHLEIEEHPRAVARDIAFYGFAERLIHKELSNYQYQWLCDCGTRHREYFQVSEDVAVKVFERWRDFCDQKPWDLSGKILPVWSQRLQNRARCRTAEHNFDHLEFARHWDTFTNPMSFERILSDLLRVLKLGFPERWRNIALAEFLTIVCFSGYSFLTKLWTVIVVSMVLIDTVFTEDMHFTARMSQLMGGGLQSLMLGQTSPKDRKVVETKGLTPEANPGDVLYESSSRAEVHQLRRESAAATSQPLIDMTEPINDGDDLGSPESAANKDSPDKDARSSTSVDVTSTRSRVSKGKECLYPPFQKCADGPE